MPILTLKPRRTYSAMAMFVVTAALLIVRVMPFGYHTLIDQTPTIAAVIFTAMLARLEFNIGRRRVEFDSAAQEIRIAEFGFLGGMSTSTYAVANFGLIVSYLTRDRFVRNPVVLITWTKPWHMLVVASFSPGSNSSGFISMPRVSESLDAASVRTQVAKHLGIQDGGFLPKEIRLPHLLVKKS